MVRNSVLWLETIKIRNFSSTFFILIFRWTPSRGQCKDHASQHASPSPIVFNKTQKEKNDEKDSEEKYGWVIVWFFGNRNSTKFLSEMFYQNFIPYIALQVNDHHELHAIAVRLGMNEYQFAAVLGAVSNNLLTKRFLSIYRCRWLENVLFSQVILENWRNLHEDIGEEDLLKKLELVFTSLRRHDLAHSIKTSRKCVKKRRKEEAQKEAERKRREEEEEDLRRCAEIE